MWDLPSIAVEASQAGEAARYTNAKVLLVGGQWCRQVRAGISAYGRSVHGDYFNRRCLGDTIAAAAQHRAAMISSGKSGSGTLPGKRTIV